MIFYKGKTMKLKPIIIKLAAGFLRGASAAGSFIASKSGALKAPLSAIGQFFFYGIIFPLYKGFYYFKYKILNIYAPAKSKFFYFLSKSYFVHFLLVTVGVIVIANSISAADLRQDNFGETTIVYSLFATEDYEQLTVDSSIPRSQSQSFSYLDNTASVQSQKFIGEISGEPQFNSGISTITQGGNAVVKPNIIKPAVIGPSGTISSQGGIATYVVQSGDTISSIAGKFKVSADTIIWQNNLGSRAIIHLGDKLEILPVSGVVHRVARGETVGSIAKKYSIGQDQIISFNNLFNASDIRIGQELIIPGGKKIVPRAIASSTIPKVSPITQLFESGSSARASVSGLIWPAAIHRITQYFSWRHQGLDIGITPNSPIYSAEDGTAVLAGWSTGYGNNVIIDHGNGIKTRYAHLNRIFVKAGETVDKGQVIGLSGSTGWSTGPHLHFEIIIRGIRKNPLSYIN